MMLENTIDSKENGKRWGRTKCDHMKSSTFIISKLILTISWMLSCTCTIHVHEMCANTVQSICTSKRTCTFVYWRCNQTENGKLLAIHRVSEKKLN